MTEKLGTEKKMNRLMRMIDNMPINVMLANPDDISSQITEIQTATANAVSAIQGISGTITEVSEIASAIAPAAEEKSAATHEIAHSVEQAASGTIDVSENIIGVIVGTQQTVDASGQALEAASELSKQAEMLRSEVDGFLVEVRSL